MKLYEILFERMDRGKMVSMLGNYIKKWVFGEGHHSSLADGRIDGLPQSTFVIAKQVAPKSIYNGVGYRAIAIRVDKVDHIPNVPKYIKQHKAQTGLSLVSWAVSESGVIGYLTQGDSLHTSMENSIHVVIRQEISQGVDLSVAYEALVQQGYDEMDEHDQTELEHMLSEQEEIVAAMNNTAQVVYFLAANRDHKLTKCKTIQDAVQHLAAAKKEIEDGYDAEDDDEYDDEEWS